MVEAELADDMKKQLDPNIVDQQFRAAKRSTYLHQYFGDALFHYKILVGVNYEWEAIYSYQKSNAVNIICCM